MPTTYPSIYFGFVALLDGGVDPEKDHNAYTRFTINLTGDSYKMIDGVFVPTDAEDFEFMPGVMKHYVQPGTGAPQKGAVTYTSGTFVVSTKGGLPFIELQSFSAVDVKGDPDAEDYLNNCPDPMPLQVSVTGITSKPIQPPFEADIKLRGFHLESYVYKSADERAVPLKLVCFFPHQKRWTNTQIPRRGALVCVTGQIIGVHMETKCFVVLIQGFNYINSTGTDVATRSSQSEASPESSQQGNSAARWGRKRAVPSPLAVQSSAKRLETAEPEIQVPSTPPQPQRYERSQSVMPDAAMTAPPSTQSSWKKGKATEVDFDDTVSAIPVSILSTSKKGKQPAVAFEDLPPPSTQPASRRRMSTFPTEETVNPSVLNLGPTLTPTPKRGYKLNTRASKATSTAKAAKLTEDEYDELVEIAQEASGYVSLGDSVSGLSDGESDDDI